MIYPAVEELVDSEEEVRRCEQMVLNKMNWIVDNVSPLDTTKILMRKFFEFKEYEYDIEKVQGYLEGLILASISMAELLEFDYLQKSLITIFAFFDILDYKDLRKDFLQWLASVADLDVVSFGHFLKFGPFEAFDSSDEFEAV